MLAREKLML